MGEKLVLLAMGLWQRYRSAGSLRAGGYAVAATVPTVLAPLAIMPLVANIQATSVAFIALSTTDLGRMPSTNHATASPG